MIARPFVRQAAIATAAILVVGIPIAMNPSPAASTKATVHRAFQTTFVPNVGQAQKGVEFLARSRAATLRLDGSGATTILTRTVATGPPMGLVTDDASRNRSVAVRMDLVNARRDVQLVGTHRSAAYANFLTGNDPRNWHVRVPLFERVVATAVYPGIDLIYRGQDGLLEYDFVVAPGGDPNDIALRFSGVDRISIGSGGDLVFETAAGIVRHARPVIYQDIAGHRRLVTGGYRVSGSIVRPWVGLYDRSVPLVIDPVIDYSTFFGGANSDEGQGIDVDNDGNIYITGDTASVDFPTQAAVQPSNAGNRDAFVAKFSSDGSTLLYSTFLGGSGEERARGIDVDSAGSVYVGGATFSTNFPIVGGVQQVNKGEQDAYLTKLSPTGDAIVYSTYLGGEAGEGRVNVAVDATGAAYLSGFTMSLRFPVVNPIQASRSSSLAEVFAAKLSPAGNSLIYSTYLGSTDHDTGRGIAVDASGSAYVCGWTQSTNFPTTPGAFQTVPGGGGDTFVFKLTPSGGLAWSTLVGGRSTDWPYNGNCIALDSGNNVYVAGYTLSSDFPTLSAAQPTYRGSQDAYAFKLSADGATMLFSTFLGGTRKDEGISIDTDSVGNAYVVGSTASPDFPVLSTMQTFQGRTDAFITKLNSAGAIMYSTYLGGKYEDLALGVKVDANSVANIVGDTKSSNFPTVRAYQPLYRADNDVFVAKIASTGDEPPPAPVAPTITSAPADNSPPDVTFTFTHPDPSVSFSCSLDDPSAYQPCTSPTTYTGLAHDRHTFRVRVTDTRGVLSAPTSHIWFVGETFDFTPPTVTMSKPASDELLKSTSVQAKWSAVDDTGVTSYTVYERIGILGSQAVVQSGTATSFNRTGTVGTTYCYQVFAFDAAGNEDSGEERCTAVPTDDRDASISYTGATTQAGSVNAFGGTLTNLSGAGSQVAFACTCRKLGILVQKGPDEGRVRIYLDNVLKSTIDLYSSSVQNKYYMATIAVPYGAHTLRLEATGDKNASSTDTKIPIDAIAFIS